MRHPDAMTRSRLCAVLLVGGSAACVIEEPLDLSTTEQYGINMQGINMQGINMQGINMQGINMQGINMQGFALGGATLQGPVNLRVERGELVAQRGSQTMRGTALAGLRLTGVWSNSTETVSV